MPRPDAPAARQGLLRRSGRNQAGTSDYLSEIEEVVATLTALRGPEKGRTFTPGEGPTLIGRGSERIPISDNTVSRRHAELRCDNGQWVLEDLKSANGTYVNGRRIERPTGLKHGDLIRVGSTTLAWSDEAQVIRPRGRAAAADLVLVNAGQKSPDAAVISTVPSNDDSVILASPATADAVRAWRVMAQLAEAVGVESSTEGLLDRVIDILFEQVPANRGFILLRSEETGEFEPVVVRYRGANEAPDKIATSRTIIQHVVSRREGVLCTNAMSDQRFASHRRSGSIQAFGLRSVVCAPLMARDEVLGVIHIDSAMSHHIYTEDQLRLVTAIGRMSGLAIQNASLVAQRLAIARLAATGQAVAALSHAIKNILQGMQGGADVVEMGLARAQLGVIDQGWQIVQHNLERVLALSLNMLAYSKERTPRCEMAQINPVIHDVVKLMQRRADEKGVMIVAQCEDPFPPVPIDVDGIHQAVLNVVTNAIDAVPKGTGVVNVKTRFDVTANEARILVADNGPGIPPEQLAHLFEPFRSTKGHAGTGLGLAVAQKIVQEHRGRIEIRSEVNHGTQVAFHLPATEGGAIDSGATLAPSGG